MDEDEPEIALYHMLIVINFREHVTVEITHIETAVTREMLLLRDVI